jgi:lipopolysaccharide transport system ATP-binding protein
LWQQATTSKETQILAVVVEDASGNDAMAAQMGETLRFAVWYQAEEVAPVHVSVVLKNRYDQVVNCTSSYTLGLEMPSSLGRNVASFTLALKMQLEAGQYSLQVSLGTVGSNSNQGNTLDETPWLGPLTLSWDYSASVPPFYGMFGLPVQTSASIYYQLTSR